MWDDRDENQSTYMVYQTKDELVIKVSFGKYRRPDEVNFSFGEGKVTIEGEGSFEKSMWKNTRKFHRLTAHRAIFHDFTSMNSNRRARLGSTTSYGYYPLPMAGQAIIPAIKIDTTALASRAGLIRLYHSNHPPAMTNRAVRKVGGNHKRVFTPPPAEGTGQLSPL